VSAIDTELMPHVKELDWDSDDQILVKWCKLHLLCTFEQTTCSLCFPPNIPRNYSII